MKINNVLYLSLITLLLLSIIPYTLSACTKVPVADDATKEKAKEEKDKAEKELDKAEKELKDLRKQQLTKWIAIIATGHEDTGQPEALANDVGHAVELSDRGDLINAAKKKVAKAEEAHNTALTYWESVQDEEVHPRYIPSCGNRSHGITMCDPDEMDKYMDQYWRQWHEVRQASCGDYITIDGIKYYCTISNFFFCQFHTHKYGLPYSSNSN